MGEFRDHSNKKVIREQWCKPLLKFIHDALGYKLIYLGLPGPEALDLLVWIEYLEQIIAFQCRDYPHPSSIAQSNKRVLELEEKLRKFEREGTIKTFALYDGYLEEVILKGRDTCGNHFNQNDIVTIYNLDFCNGITSPQEVIDEKGDVQSCYKSEVIRKLLEIQRDISLSTSKRCKKFVMFLTIHSDFWYKEVKRFTSQNQDPNIKHFIRISDKLNGQYRRIKLLKAYMYHIVMNFFCHCDFTPEFLPVIYYKGIGADRQNWLMHFTFVGSFNKQVSGLAPCLQNPQNYLEQKFLQVVNEKIGQIDVPGVTEIDCPQDLVEAFENSLSYNRLWKKIK